MPDLDGIDTIFPVFASGIIVSTTLDACLVLGVFTTGVLVIFSKLDFELTPLKGLEGQYLFDPLVRIPAMYCISMLVRYD